MEVSMSLNALVRIPNSNSSSSTRHRQEDGLIRHSLFYTRLTVQNPKKQKGGGGGILVVKAKGKRGGMQARQFQRPPPPPMPKIEDDGNPRFVIFIRMANVYLWYPLSIVAGGTTAKIMVAAKDNFLGKYIYKDTLARNLAETVLSLQYIKYYKLNGFWFKELYLSPSLRLTVNMLRRWRGQNLQQNDSSERDTKVEDVRTALGPLSGHSLKFCTDACLRRYLEARNWNVDKATKMLEETLKWRSTFKPEEIRWHEVAHEGETGKVSRANFHDRSGRTVLIMRPGMQNTTSAEGNIRHLVYLIENAILNLPEGQEQMSWLIDFNGWSLNTNIPIKTARDIIYVLQNHYPERLAIVVLYSPPRFFETFWKVVKFFVDPKTFQKIKFVYPNNKESAEVMKSCFDAENLPSEFGGKTTLKYDHEEFSRLMAQEDVKTAKFWGFDNKPCHDMTAKRGTEVTLISGESRTTCKLN